MARKFGRALRTKAAFQVDIDTLAAGPWFGLTTYRRGDPATPDLVDDPVLGIATDNNRDPIAPQFGMQKGDVQRTVPMALDEVGMWFTACFGLPTSAGALGAYTHTFKSGAEALPYLTVQDLLAAGQFRQHRGVVVDGFSIQATKENAYPQLVLDLLMRDCGPAADWIAGDDAAAFGLQRPPAWGATVLWNDVAIGESTTCSLQYKNNCDRNMGLNGTEFPVSIDPGLSAVSGNLGMRLNTDTYHALARAGGAPGKLSLVWKLPGATATRSLQIDYNLVRLSANGQPVENAGEISSQFTMRGEQGAAGTPAVTVLLKNNVETYALAEEP